MALDFKTIDEKTDMTDKKQYYHVNIEKMQQHLMNISEMLNSRVYNLLIEFADMRNEIRQLQMDLHGVIEEMKNE
jgi:predicted  nucleic acid-binding Zn-ribbon protein